MDIKIEKSKKLKQKPDFSKLGFGKYFTEHMFMMDYSEEEGWHDARIVPFGYIPIHPASTVLHYGAEIFEGMKAYKTKDGYQMFRPTENLKRLNDSAERLCLPTVPEDLFIDALVQLINLDYEWIPSEVGTSLYIRPYMFGSNPVIGVKPADEYQFRILTTPVGPYFKGGVKPLTIRVSDFDRAAPNGTGHIKAGLNYAMSLYQIMDAHRNGFDENLYLDPGTRTKIEETGGANVLLVKKDGTIVIPKSPSILPSITRRSLVTIASDVLGMKVEEREVLFQEVKDGEFAECGLCGTAAVISPVGRIYDHGTYYDLPSGMEGMGPVTKKLYDTLTGIQMGTIEGPEGWVHVID
jgi:branched-chain amino acid aminotransferase